MSLKIYKSRLGTFAGRLCSILDSKSDDDDKRQCHVRRIIYHVLPNNVCSKFNQSFLWVWILLVCNTFVKSLYLFYISCFEQHTLGAFPIKS
jgi:hypothetical protein